MSTRVRLTAAFFALVVLGAIVVLVAWYREQDRRVVEEATRVLPVSRDQEPPR